MSSDANGLGRILVVDDEEPVRDVLCEYFESQGFGVEGAPDGEAALAALGRLRPDLVLLDVRMPGIDGVEVLRRIRRADPDVPVIMVTANEDVALAKEMLKLGAFDYVAKPFDFSYLDRAVTAGLRRAVAASARRPRRPSRPTGPGRRWRAPCSALPAAWPPRRAARRGAAWRPPRWRRRGWPQADNRKRRPSTSASSPCSWVSPPSWAT